MQIERWLACRTFGKLTGMTTGPVEVDGTDEPAASTGTCRPVTLDMKVFVV